MAIFILTKAIFSNIFFAVQFANLAKTSSYDKIFINERPVGYINQTVAVSMESVSIPWFLAFKQTSRVSITWNCHDDMLVKNEFVVQGTFNNHMVYSRAPNRLTKVDKKISKLVFWIKMASWVPPRVRSIKNWLKEILDYISISISISFEYLSEKII